MDEKLQQFYSRMSGKELSEQEVFEADKNFVGLFELLIKIDKRNEVRKKNKTEPDNSPALCQS